MSEISILFFAAPSLSARPEKIPTGTEKYHRFDLHTVSNNGDVTDVGRAVHKGPDLSMVSSLFWEVFFLFLRRRWWASPLQAGARDGEEKRKK